MTGFVQLAAPWMAVSAVILALIAAAAVFMARSLFTLAMSIAAFCACMAGGVAALGFGDASLALAVFGAAIAPVVLLGGMLLTARSVKPRKSALPWLSIVAALGAAAAMLWAIPTIDLSASITKAQGSSGADVVAVLFAACVGCIAVLGYGERGVLESRKGDPA
jgi:hypothetical protein